MRSIRGRAEPRRPAGAFARAAALLPLLALAPACSSELPAPIPSVSPEGAAPRRGGVLDLATFGDVRASLDPANITDGLAPQIVEQLFAGLVDYDKDGRIQPDIAERWIVDDDGTTYRFFLRPGVRFHDGDEVTADDVKRSAERALHGSAPNPSATSFSMIVGADEILERRADTRGRRGRGPPSSRSTWEKAHFHVFPSPRRPAPAGLQERRRL